MTAAPSVAATRPRAVPGPVALFLGATWLAFSLAKRRDLGAGLLADRPGRPAASAALRGPFSLASRLQWPALAGWSAGYAVMFAVCGAAAKGIGQLVGSSGGLTREFTRIGGQAAVLNAYLTALMLIGGLVAAAYGVTAVLRLHTEETADRADPVLAGSVGRVRWGLSHLVVAFAGTAVLLMIAGMATGLGYGALPDGCVAVAWTAVGLAVVLNIFGQAFQLSHWVLDISPFTHVPRLPGGTVAVTPLFWLSVTALALSAAGLAALRRRDIAG